MALNKGHWIDEFTLIGVNFIKYGPGSLHTNINDMESTQFKLYWPGNDKW